MPSAAISRPFCPSLPSSEFANDLIGGDAKASLGVVGTTLFRGALIGAGIYVFRYKEDRPKVEILKDSIAGAAMVEVFVLGWLIGKRAYISSRDL